MQFSSSQKLIVNNGIYFKQKLSLKIELCDSKESIIVEILKRAFPHRFTNYNSVVFYIADLKSLFKMRLFICILLSFVVSGKQIQHFHIMMVFLI